MSVRRAGAGDWAAAGALLHRFNREYDTPTPGAEAIAARLAELDDTVVLLARDGPDDIAVVRLRRSRLIRTEGPGGLLMRVYERELEG